MDPGEDQPTQAADALEDAPDQQDAAVSAEIAASQAIAATQAAITELASQDEPNPPEV